MPAFSLTPVNSFPQQDGTEFPQPLRFSLDGTLFTGPITQVDFTGGDVTEDGDGTLTVPLGGGGGGGYNTGAFVIQGTQRFGGTDGFGTYAGYGTDINDSAKSSFTVIANADNVSYTNEGSGPMVLDEGTWLVTVFAEVYESSGGGASAGTGADAPKLNIEVQSPFLTMDNIFDIPVGVTLFTHTMSTTVITAGPLAANRTLIIRGYAQWDVVGNAAAAFDARVDLQVFLTKIAAAPTYVG